MVVNLILTTATMRMSLAFLILVVLHNVTSKETKKSGLKAPKAKSIGHGYGYNKGDGQGDGYSGYNGGGSNQGYSRNNGYGQGHSYSGGGSNHGYSRNNGYGEGHGYSGGGSNQGYSRNNGNEQGHGYSGGGGVGTGGKSGYAHGHEEKHVPIKIPYIDRNGCRFPGDVVCDPNAADPPVTFSYCVLADESKNLWKKPSMTVATPIACDDVVAGTEVLVDFCNDNERILKAAGLIQTKKGPQHYYHLEKYSVFLNPCILSAN